MKCPKPALCGLCYSWLLVRDEVVMCAPHVIGEKMLVQQMAQANKELKAGIEVRIQRTALLLAENVLEEQWNEKAQALMDMGAKLWDTPMFAG
ncbi:hypothetical protein [Pseudomonas syringae]|uniref:hypothetical protein n=1 Tax=Pseudomonas syringae TaxID=317 RepID=UPI0010724AE0|nr:hypothetical protein [Pseudomonas syringae]